MPSVALHSHYWQTQAPEVPVVPGASGSGGYPNWQMTVVGVWAFWLLTATRVF
jgi:hypothetical protein